MDERYAGAPASHEQFITTMQAVMAARPGFGKALGEAVGRLVEAEQADGVTVEVLADPHDIVSEDAAAMGHNMAGLQGLDLAPFGLAVSVTQETGGDGSTESDSKIVLDDGEAFAGFLRTIKPEHVDNYGFMDREDSRWWLRRGLNVAVRETFGGAANELRAQEAGEAGGLSHSTQELLEHGEHIADALADSGWPHDRAGEHIVREMHELPKYAAAGIATGYLHLDMSGILDNDVAHGPAGWLQDGPLEDTLIQDWQQYADAARQAAEKSPELAGTWPAQVRRHYEAAIEHLQDRGRITELMMLEAIGEEIRNA